MTSKLTVMYQGQPEGLPDIPDNKRSPTTAVVQDGPFPWVKGIDIDSWPEPVAQLFPGKRALARFWTGGDNKEHAYMERGTAGATDYANALMDRYYRVYEMGVRDLLGPNEPHPNADNWRAYEEFQATWVKRVAALGFRPWVWSFGVGWPGLLEGGDNVTVRQFIGSIGLAKEAGGGLELHEYGAPQVLSGDGWWTLRYRRVLRELQTAGLHDVPIWIGECGIDGGVIGKTGWGWKRFTTLGDYWLQLSAYDDQLAQDSEVVAASPFVTNPNDAAWASFDVAEWLLAQMSAKHDAIPPEPPEPPEPPGDCCAELREKVAVLSGVCAGLDRRMTTVEQVLKELCYVGADACENWSEWLDRLGRLIGPRED